MTHTLAHELKQAGFPQPEPKPGQMWYDDGRDCCAIILSISENILGLKPIYSNARCVGFEYATFAPSLDDIAPLLPPTFALEYWDGKPSCTNRDEEKPIRTYGETFTEAAARMWLETKRQS